MSDVDKVIAKLEKLALESIKGSIADSVAQLYKEIVDRTPVDTGEAHRSWEINYGFGFNKAAATFQGKQQSVIDKDRYQLGTTIEIRNELPYMQRLEYGWSKQAPKGMVRISSLKFRQFLNTAIKNNKL